MYGKYKLRSNFKIFVLLIVVALLLFPLAGILLFLINVEDNVTCNGIVSAEANYELVSHVSGRIRKMELRTGQRVTKGEVLAWIDTTEYENELLALQTEIRQLEAEKAVAEVVLENQKQDPLSADLWHAPINLMESEEKEARAKDKLARYTSLLEENVISEVELKNIELEYVEAKAALQRARNNYERVKNGLAERTILKAEKDLQLVITKLENRKALLPVYQKRIRDCRIVAPADGLIVDIPCRNSMYVKVGEPAIVIAGGKDTMVWAYVDEAFIRKIKIGQQAQIRSEIFSHIQYGNFEAEVIKIADTPAESADGMVRYPVKLRLDTDNFNIKYGSKVTVSIMIGEAPAVYTLLNISDEDQVIQRRIEKLRKKSEKRKG